VTVALDWILDRTVLPGYTRVGYRARGLRWDDAVAGRLDRRVALVTGASSGLGEAACEGLARAGARVHMLVRDLERGSRAAERVRARLGESGARSQLTLELCDLSDLEAVSGFTASFAAREPDLAVLVNNAGVLPQRREHTDEGHELSFATNVLGPFVLTEGLLPVLRAGAPGRVVTVTSGGMYTSRLRGDDLELERREFDGPGFYAHTKRAEVVLTELWHEQEEAAGGRARFAAVHPGWADTPGLQASLPRFRKLLRPLLRDAHEGADTIVWLSTAPADRVPGGLLWHDRRPRPAHRLPSTRESAADREALWTACKRAAEAAASPNTNEGDN
jgi:NAD(P)-dependent dehydrogenase (short-subunit alcohol dehydrogenase family)